MADSTKMNQVIKSWTKNTKGDLTKEFDRLSIEHVPRSPSKQAARDLLATLTAMRQGTINKVSFKFPRHMVFVHKGVGKGVPAGFTGSTTRRAKEWFNPVMDKDIEKLADIVADNQADYVTKNLLIK